MSLGTLSLKNFKSDFMASIIVFLVAIPLCIGIAAACGFPPIAGLISGILGGIVVGAFAGCPLQVSGPAAGLITIVWSTVQDHGIENFGAIILLAGLIQASIGLLGLAPWFRAVSPAIIQGMLTGIGLLISISQIHVMLDHKPSNNAINNIMAIPNTIAKGVFPIDGSTHHLAAGIGILTILILMLWHFAPSKLRVLPSTLVAVVCSIVIANFFNFPIKYINISGSFLDALNTVTISSIKHLFSYEAFVSAASIAFIASAETLLSATAVDKLKAKSKTDYNKEILSQGIGNSLAGVLGVLPVTGVIVRSAANIHAGASSRASAIMHGVWILMFVVLFPFALKFIPSACLAAILVYTGYKLVNVQIARTIYNFSRGEFIVYTVTVIAIISTNLLEGILIGVALSVFKNIYKLARFSVQVIDQTEKSKTIIKITGNLTFLRLPQVANIIENLKPGLDVNVIFEHTNLVDHAIIDLLIGWSSRYIKSGGNVLIDWNHIKRVYPGFGWDTLNELHPNIDKITTPYALRDCAKCTNYYNSAAK